MRKVFIVAVREFVATVATKGFLVGLVCQRSAACGQRQAGGNDESKQVFIRARHDQLRCMIDRESCEARE